MATYRTAIRRGLAVRRPPYRPPGRGRKPQHGSIVAPLAATVAATLAAGALVRAGAALGRAERDRRLRAQREGPAPFPPPAGRGGGRRGTPTGRLENVLDLLKGEREPGGAAHAVHETRKALKRLRALM